VSDENPPKKKRGRPPLPEGAGKEFTLRVRMPTALWEALKSASSREYLTASELVRKLVEEHLGKS
jgi:hypothetical protein